MNYIEKMLSKVYNMEYTYFTGNATTGLYLIFKSLNITKKKIVFPNITCMAPVNAAIYAGYEVVFCDVNIDDFTMNIASLKELMDKEEIGIVVPTHIYGYMCNTKDIYELCNNNNIIVVEDGAQTVEISQYNDFGVTSFGHTKIFETNIGGGAIFYKDVHAKEKFDYFSKDLSGTSNNDDFKLYTTEYYRIAKTLVGNEYYLEMKKLQINSKDIFLRHFKENEELVYILENRDSIIEKRKKRFELYKNNLYKDNFVISDKIVENMNPLWRLSLLIKNINRDKFVEEARKINVDISTWYPCLHKFYSNQEDSDLKNSIYISDNIVNFWVTEKYSESKIKDDIVEINKILKNNSLMG